MKGEPTVSKSERLPVFNLEGVTDKGSGQLYVNMAWSMLDTSARHNVQKNAHALITIEAKSKQILRDSSEKAQAAEIDTMQNEQCADITVRHIEAQKDVIRACELQLKIARLTLTNVLGVHNELLSIEQENVTVHNNFRDAALDYLAVQSQMVVWVGIRR